MTDAIMTVDDPASTSVAGVTSDVYEVNESGIHYRPMPTPKDGRAFIERFRSNFKINILERPSENDLIFELIGVDASFANALRRIMMAEVPTVAIEHVYMWNNSSIIHDEVLSHRLGMVPINVDPRLFNDFIGDDDEATDRNTIVFRLCVECGKRTQEDETKKNDEDTTAKKEVRPTVKVEDSIAGNIDLDSIAAESAKTHRNTHMQGSAAMEAIEFPRPPYTKHIYTHHLEWVPQGDQAARFPLNIHPVHKDILLAKLRPGQVIELEAHGRRGVGKDHAKFSPVSTAAYRLMPQVTLLHPVYDDKARELAHTYEPGVFRLDPCNVDEDGWHEVKAVVQNPYACTMSRNYMRDPELKKAVKITRLPNHFIFSIESVGMIQPGVILTQSLKILQDKCRRLIQLLDESLETEGLNE